ncbi:hypothetical protein ACIGO9_26710 [Nocardia asteroides]
MFINDPFWRAVLIGAELNGAFFLAVVHPRRRGDEVLARVMSELDSRKPA